MNVRLLLILAASFLVAAFTGKNTDTYGVDAQKSILAWEGHKFFGGKHTGNIGITSGELFVEGDKLKGGKFIIDMNSVKVTDLQGETADKLAAHLKTADFFDATNYPLATFEIKHVDYADDKNAAVVGDITIRGITQQINFLAEIDVNDGSVYAVAKGVRVNRTVHDAKYGSVSFFRDLGRKIVSDEFTLDVELYAQK